MGVSFDFVYSKTETHVSAVAHKNTEGGWLVASMIGYEEDGVALLDQELIISQKQSTLGSPLATFNIMISSTELAIKEKS